MQIIAIVGGLAWLVYAEGAAGVAIAAGIGLMMIMSLRR